MLFLVLCPLGRCLQAMFQACGLPCTGLGRHHCAFDGALQPATPCPHCLQAMESHALPRGNSGNPRAWSGPYRPPHPQLLQGRHACGSSRLALGCRMCQPSSCTLTQWLLHLLLRVASSTMLLMEAAGSRWLHAWTMQQVGWPLLLCAAQWAATGALVLSQAKAATSMRRARAWGQESVSQASIWQREGCSLNPGR